MENFNSRGEISNSARFTVRRLFSFNGRLRRKYYWLISFVCGLIESLFQSLIENTTSLILIFLFLVVTILYIWIVLATNTKRCHDLGHNGWWQLIPFYSLWMAFQNSQFGDNEYGPNPKGE